MKRCEKIHEQELGITSKKGVRRMGGPLSSRKDKKKTCKFMFQQKSWGDMKKHMCTTTFQPRTCRKTLIALGEQNLHQASHVSPASEIDSASEWKKLKYFRRQDITRAQSDTNPPKERNVRGQRDSCIATFAIDPKPQNLPTMALLSHTGL